MKMLPGFVAVYNRLPTSFDFMHDGHPYVLAAREVYAMPVPVAMCAIKQSMYYLGHSEYSCSVVPEGDPMFGIELSPESLNSKDLIASHSVELDKAQYVYKVVPVPEGNVGMPERRRSVDSMVHVTVGPKAGL